MIEGEEEAFETEESRCAKAWWPEEKKTLRSFQVIQHEGRKELEENGLTILGDEEIGRSKILHISKYPQKLRIDLKVNGS